MSVKKLFTGTSIFSCLLAIATLTTSCRSGNFYKREIHRLEGVSETRLEKRFGPPETVLTYTVSHLSQSPEPWHEPIPKILSMHPAESLNGQDIPIKFFSWYHERICLTVWLHQIGNQWVSFYAEEWNMDVIE